MSSLAMDSSHNELQMAAGIVRKQAFHTSYGLGNQNNHIRTSFFLQNNTLYFMYILY